ncbi:hypothetical protein BCL69_100429 [Nitrosomonas communis]|uniref:Uncharacterized protein n=1 Tax=Nitrosomonas communis TaxID=44574 RepID=A0A5D3YI61_9PROT|nr:hypothetical protein BCL69_100429 [Nitrosomonas communis]
MRKIMRKKQSTTYSLTMSMILAAMLTLHGWLTFVALS